jgi:threonine aldolase
MGSMLAAATLPLHLFGNNYSSLNTKNSNSHIDFIYDGEFLFPHQFSELLLQLIDEGKVKTDNYSNGGIIEELEHKFATILGKESAVFMPTGTMANHIAIRELAKNRRKVIVQEQSHIYNDSGDCCQTLSNLNLIPLGKNQTYFTLDDVKEVYAKTKAGKVETTIGVISIESLVRRQNDTMFGFDNMKEISEYARNKGIKMHLDGARLFIEMVHTGISPKVYGQLFDTVYTSMYKCFNSQSGAILAGNKKFTEKLFHIRRMFGGGLPHVWPFAAIALHYVDGFEDSYKKTLVNTKIFFNELTKDERFTISEFKNGTHIVKLHVNHKNLLGFKDLLSKKNIHLRFPEEKGFKLKINPSINRYDPKHLAESFIDSLNALN